MTDPLTLIGKSTELIRRIRRHTVAKQRCFVIKYSGDIRYSDENMATHDRFLTSLGLLGKADTD